jgi:hypothetical protein
MGTESIAQVCILVRDCAAGRGFAIVLAMLFSNGIASAKDVGGGSCRAFDRQQRVLEILV